MKHLFPQTAALRFFSSIIALLIASTTAQASLILHISPDGTGGTRWEFTGSTIAVSDSSENSFWGENSGTLANADTGSGIILTGSGILSTTSDGSESVNDVWVSTDTFAGIAPRIFGSIYWSAGDVLSWSGDLTSNSPFANLNLGTVVTYNILEFSAIEDPLIITVSNTPLAGVPVPATIALLGIGIACISCQRRRKAA